MYEMRSKFMFNPNLTIVLIPNNKKNKYYTHMQFFYEGVYLGHTYVWLYSFTTSKTLLQK